MHTVEIKTIYFYFRAVFFGSYRLFSPHIILIADIDGKIFIGTYSRYRDEKENEDKNRIPKSISDYVRPYKLFTPTHIYTGTSHSKIFTLNPNNVDIMIIIRISTWTLCKYLSNCRFFYKRRRYDRQLGANKCLNIQISRWLFTKCLIRYFFNAEHKIIIIIKYGLQIAN